MTTTGERCRHCGEAEDEHWGTDGEQKHCDPHGRTPYAPAPQASEGATEDVGRCDECGCAALRDAYRDGWNAAVEELLDVGMVERRGNKYVCPDCHPDPKP